MIDHATSSASVHVAAERRDEMILLLLLLYTEQGEHCCAVPQHDPRQDQMWHYD
jgi:hypothetical protein